MLAGLPAFADIFPLIKIEIQSKSFFEKPAELVKLFGNGTLSDKSVILSRIKINNRVKDQQKTKDAFKRRQRPFWNKRTPGKGIPGMNYSLSFLLSKKVIFRPQEKDK